MPMRWMQCPTRWMQYVVTNDTVLTKVDAACCDIGRSDQEGGCSDPAMVAVPHAVSLSVNCSAEAVDALSQKMDALCCDGRGSAHEG